jgi:hypothetical protein
MVVDVPSEFWPVEPASVVWSPRNAFVAVRVAHLVMGKIEVSVMNVTEGPVDFRGSVLVQSAARAEATRKEGK